VVLLARFLILLQHLSGQLDSPWSRMAPPVGGRLLEPLVSASSRSLVPRLGTTLELQFECALHLVASRPLEFSIRILRVDFHNLGWWR
jgi:hypothetical protein